MVLPDQAGQDFSRSLFETTSRDEEESFDIRFYNSLIGKQLDNYKALSFIGAGTMGGVFKGWDIALERAVAIKVISYKLASQEAFREMFIKEADGWAFIADSQDLLDDLPKDPVALLDGLDKKYTLAVRVNVGKDHPRAHIDDGVGSRDGEAEAGGVFPGMF